MQMQFFCDVWKTRKCKIVCICDQEKITILYFETIRYVLLHYVHFEVKPFKFL